MQYSERIATLLYAAIALVFAAILQLPFAFEFPGYMHGWAQADRLALANGFIRNGFDLFHPETQVYNAIYPHDFSVQGVATITAVDCPLHDYIASILMSMSEKHDPVIFRFYVIFMGVIALVYIGRIARFMLKDEVKALFVVVFAALSPAFVYYQGSLLPTIPNVALTAAGIYYYVKSRTEEAGMNFFIAIACLAIAMLTRTTFAVPFVAVICMEVIDYRNSRKVNRPRLLAVSAVVLVFFIYRYYNNTLMEAYGSMFLNRLMPARSGAEFIELIEYVWTNWRFSYFSSIHYWSILIIGLSVLYIRFSRKNTVPSSNSLSLFVLIYTVGCLLFAAAMLRQFRDHDYYFLDTFYLPALLGLMYLLSFVPSTTIKSTRYFYLFLLAFFVASAFRMPQRAQRSRHAVEYSLKLQSTIRDYTGSNDLMDSIGIPADAVMLVMDAASPNTALTLMNRKGLVILNPQREVIEHALQWRFDFLVVQNDFLQSDSFSNYPGMLEGFEMVGGSDRISVYKPL
jgi:hypothetical protein